jgi:hypothetical protein
MVRIMILTNRIGVYSGNTGGGSAMREKLCAALKKEGHELNMFAAGLNENADVGITDYSPMLLPSLRTLRAIWSMLKQSDVLIVSGSFSPCIPYGVLVARLLGVKSLVPARSLLCACLRVRTGVFGYVDVCTACLFA